MRLTTRLLAAALALCAFAPDAASAVRPNVVVLMTDDQTVADLEAMPRTQGVLARQGVSFDRSYVSYPVCCPSRATYLSGQYAHNHGVLGLYPPTGGYGRFDHSNALPVWLERAGYATAHIGKYMNGYRMVVGAQQPPGWTEWYGAVDGSTYLMWGYTLDENGVARTYGTALDEDPRLYQTDVYRRKAVDFIERRAPSPRPFFLSVAFLAPHHENRAVRRLTGRLVRPAPRHARALADAPLETPPGFAEHDRSDKPRFLRRRHAIAASGVGRIAQRSRDRRASLLAVDEAVEAIVAALRRTGELENTYVILTSDNGYMQGEHGVPERQDAPLRPVHARAADRPRPGHPRRRRVAPAGRQRRPRPDDRAARRRATGPGVRRPVAAALRPRPAGYAPRGRCSTRPEAAATSAAATRTPAACRRCDACSATAPCAPSAGSTSSTATAPASSTTSAATRGSCARSTRIPPRDRPGARSPRPCAGWRAVAARPAAPVERRCTGPRQLSPRQAPRDSRTHGCGVGVAPPLTTKNFMNGSTVLQRASKPSANDAR